MLRDFEPDLSIDTSLENPLSYSSNRLHNISVDYAVRSKRTNDVPDSIQKSKPSSRGSGAMSKRSFYYQSVCKDSENDETMSLNSSQYLTH
jgi:hypothetical protein